MKYKEILEEEIDKLNKVITQLGNINLIDYKSLMINKQNQKKLVKGYSIIFDVKMDLEKIVKKMEGKNENN